MIQDGNERMNRSFCSRRANWVTVAPEQSWQNQADMDIQAPRRLMDPTHENKTVALFLFFFYKFKGGTAPPKDPILCELLVPLVFKFG